MGAGEMAAPLLAAHYVSWQRRARDWMLLPRYVIFRIGDDPKERVGRSKQFLRPVGVGVDGIYNVLAIIAQTGAFVFPMLLRVSC